MMRNERIPVRVSDEMKRLIEELAEEAGTTVSSLVRSRFQADLERRNEAAIRALTPEELEVARKMGLTPHQYWTAKGEGGDEE